jgi:hypothetical protein
MNGDIASADHYVCAALGSLPIWTSDTAHLGRVLSTEPQLMGGMPGPIIGHAALHTAVTVKHEVGMLCLQASFATHSRGSRQKPHIPLHAVIDLGSP